MNAKSILASLALSIVFVAPAAATPQGSCCEAPKSGAACCKSARCDAPCCAPASAKATRLAKRAVAAKAKIAAKKGSSCCAMPCCDGGACCSSAASHK